MLVIFRVRFDIPKLQSIRGFVSQATRREHILKNLITTVTFIKKPRARVKEKLPSSGRAASRQLLYIDTPNVILTSEGAPIDNQPV